MAPRSAELEVDFCFSSLFSAPALAYASELVCKLRAAIGWDGAARRRYGLVAGVLVLPQASLAFRAAVRKDRRRTLAEDSPLWTLQVHAVHASLRAAGEGR